MATRQTTVGVTPVGDTIEVRFKHQGKTYRPRLMLKPTSGYFRSSPKESGAVRRASMDLTRALAEMRKPS